MLVFAVKSLLLSSDLEYLHEISDYLNNAGVKTQLQCYVEEGAQGDAGDIVSLMVVDAGKFPLAKHLLQRFEQTMAYERIDLSKVTQPSLSQRDLSSSKWLVGLCIVLIVVYGLAKITG